MQSLFPTTPDELDDDDLAELYAYPVDRRWVRANFVATLDGAAQGEDGKSESLSSRADQQLFALLRSLCDVVLVGAGTARREGYQPILESEVATELRRQLGLAPVPAIAVVSRSLSLDPALLAGGVSPTIVITTETGLANPLHSETAGALTDATTVVAGQLDVDLAGAVEALGGHGYQRILCEGGPTLMRGLTAARQLDELCLTISPQLVAGDRRRVTHGAAIVSPARLRLRHLLESDGELFCRYTTN